MAVVGRQRQAVEGSGVPLTDLEEALESSGLDRAAADAFIENALGVYALPYAILPNVLVAGRAVSIPLVTDSPDVGRLTAAASIVDRAGGLEAEATEAAMIAQVQLTEVADVAAARRAIEAAREELLRAADEVLGPLVARGGGARDLEVRVLGGPDDAMLVVHVIIDCVEAMGANLVNKAAEALGAPLARLANARLGLRILSNLCDRRLARASCRVPLDHVGDIAGRLVAHTELARLDPHHAASFNKAVMDGVDAVVIATGNDWRAVHAGAHAYATRGDRYGPLATFEVEAGALVGRVEVPLALGTVGGTLRAHRLARMSLRLMGSPGARELAKATACVGLLSAVAFGLPREL
ncbi:MAG: 3-hydroxy-3-methylglutaryl-CoA reductase [Labilithrix sp.]|nr:3-hydroxy-3-methylglutaryl-CoA reductase [Labilithrix sp.]MBX3223867.1 3-hydroxy-3-methylglutaryl-CoA reductase [Labilithrix sp.]